MIFKLRKKEETIEFESGDIMTALRNHGCTKIYTYDNLTGLGKADRVIRWRSGSLYFSVDSSGTYINGDGKIGSIYW